MSQTELASIYRIMDANANRAAEGLRVVEDYLRFHRNDEFLSRGCKQLRHDLAATLSQLNAEDGLLTCRSTLTDVGTTSQTAAEYERVSLADIVAANIRRSAEACRSLEECAKTISTAVAQEFEALRYRVYSLGKAIGHHQRGNRVLADRRLYVLVDLQYGTGEEFVARVNALLEGGVDIVQLRDKQSSDQELILAARLLKQLTAKAGALFIMNDRADIARVTHADGVHVGQEEMSIADVRLIVGPHALVGVSTHDLHQARTAVLDGADYLGIGPVFRSQTKDFESFAGLDFVSEVTREVGIPAFAIGGIDLDRLDEVTSRGGTRIAVGHALWHAADPRHTARTLKSKLAKQRASTP